MSTVGDHSWKGMRVHLDEAKRLLSDAGIQVHSEERLGNETGVLEFPAFRGEC